MIKIESTEVVGWEHAIRGMRNPLNSWSKSDSNFHAGYNGMQFKIGENDLNLMHRLAKAGTDHRKFMRMIVVYADITAPLYWWKEYDTYKVGTVANSCSTMHKIAEKEFTLDDFSHEHLDLLPITENGSRYDFNWVLEGTIEMLNKARKMYIESKTKPMKDNTKRAELTKKYWWQMIQLLPSSYNQKRTVELSYEVLANIYHARKNHKLDEWREFCGWIESLPYSELITNE